MRQSGQVALVDFLAQLPATSRLVFSFFFGCVNSDSRRFWRSFDLEVKRSPWAKTKMKEFLSIISVHFNSFCD